MILVVNAGSSSLKFHVYEIDQGEELSLFVGGQVSGIGGDHPAFRVKDAHGAVLHETSLEPGRVHDLAAAQGIMASWLQECLPEAPTAVGHRIVHGGQRMIGSVPITPDILAYLDSLSPLAPLHQRNNLAPVHVIAECWPDTPQVACFDTAFHRSQDPMLGYFAIPLRFHDQGVRRYGFHGLSYQYIAERLRAIQPEIAGGRVIAAHMGAGVSACAMVDGTSRESTMGFTALDGLPMATRPGRLDPGVILWMLEQGMGHDEIQTLLYNESGMKGLSGISSDMRTLIQSDSPSARLAVDYFTYRAAESIAGLCVATQGLDALVFTAGIGENAPEIRAGVCERLAWLGIRVDADANAENALTISRPDSVVAVLVVPTNEEYIIARETRDVIARDRHI